MPINQLPQFMAAIRQLESGGRYDAIGPYTGSTYGRARGAYQIMETIWPGWAKEAGIPGADWRDQAAQDHVARFKMGQYYRRYGRWDLVAVAWFAGPGRANEAMEKGISSVGGLQDIIGTSVASYVEKAMGLMGEVPADLQPPDELQLGAAAGTQKPEPASADEARRLQADNFANIMASISQAASAKGGKVLDLRALLGGLAFEDEPIDVEEDEPEPTSRPEPMTEREII